MASRYGPSAAQDRNDKDRNDKDRNYEEIHIAFDPALSDQRSVTGSDSKYSPFNPEEGSDLAQKLRALGEDSDLDSLAGDGTSGTPFQTAQYASIDTQLFYLMLTVRSAGPVPSAAMGATHYFITEGPLSAPSIPENAETVVPRGKRRLTPYFTTDGKKVTLRTPVQNNQTSSCRQVPKIPNHLASTSEKPATQEVTKGETNSDQ